LSILKIGIGHNPRLWPMLSLLLIVVLTPTACLLWFMNRAIENERLAVRKTLEDAYRRDLTDAQARLEQFWRDRVNNLMTAAGGLSQFSRSENGTVPFASANEKAPSAIFAKCVRSGWADSVVCYDGQGNVTYPTSPSTLPDQDEIANETADVNQAARAWQAQVRSLMQSGNIQAATELITSTLVDDKYDHAIDQQGRLIVPNAQLLALQLMKGKNDPNFDQLAARLQKRLEDYSDPTLSGTQRLFLMRELNKLSPDNSNMALLNAEELAANYVELNISPPRQANALLRSPVPDIWQLALADGKLTALFRKETIITQSNATIALATLPGDVSIALMPPDVEAPVANVFNTLAASKYLPDWQLTLSWPQGSPIDAAAGRRIALYFWTGIVVIAAISVLAGLLAQAFRNQMRYARLKNDLVATVSHELKTPLSSIRLLVDTLLDEQSPDLNKTREYLQLIAKENTRLSRLIDNFLAFSRMERDKRAFQMTETPPGAIIDEAVASVRERFEQPGCRFEVDVAGNLPHVTADADALVTVVLNLLDNAYKYSGDQKHIILRAYAGNGNVCIAVTDNGIGLSRAATKKIFDRFYQVDRRLSRGAGGCGLGLSIVKFILSAHGGTIEVDSRQNVGSTFTIKLPYNTV
jgi:signal transduction histidine kinase